jgi:hypothetical protein
MFYIVPVTDAQLGNTSAFRYAKDQLSLPPPTSLQKAAIANARRRAPKRAFGRPTFAKQQCRITSTAPRDWGSFET